MIGILREGRRWRNRKAPRWRIDLQQADLYAAVCALRLGCYMRLPYVVVATDNDVGRAQILGMRGGIFLRSQRRLLRQLFWLRSWNDRPLGVFRVSTDLNPAGPPSRMGSFCTQSDVTESVKRSQAAWKGELNRFVYLVGSLVCMSNACIVLCVPVFCFLTALRPTAGLNRSSGDLATL